MKKDGVIKTKEEEDIIKISHSLSTKAHKIWRRRATTSLSSHHPAPSLPPSLETKSKVVGHTRTRAEGRIPIMTPPSSSSSSLPLPPRAGGGLGLGLGLGLVVVLTTLSSHSTAAASASPMFFDPTAIKYSCVDMTNGVPRLLADVNTSMSEVTLLLKPLAAAAAAASVPGPSPAMGGGRRPPPPPRRRRRARPLRAAAAAAVGGGGCRMLSSG